MGNYKFRLSDMIPNAWFYKLRDMNKPNNTHNPLNKKLPSSTPQQKQRNSYYYSTESVFNSPRNSKSSDTHFPADPPRKSSKKPKRKTIYKPSPKRVSSFSEDSPNSAFSKPELTRFQDYSASSVNTSPEPDLAESVAWSSSCSCRVSSSATDIIIDVNEKSNTKKIGSLYRFDTIQETELPPILTKTKPTKFNRENDIKNSHETPLSRKSVSHYSGVKIRANSPRIASKKVQRKSSTRSRPRKERFCESFAIVKSSFDPQRDFRESMMEMIVENNIRASKDLEELLACYLSLNSDEYHDLIVKAFEQIWFKMPDLNV
ncbi:hypothetical protein LguiA_011892 [Lonicera macranthoides]